MASLQRGVMRWVARWDYGWVLPLLAALPYALARPLTVLRGLINWAFDFEWRTLSLGHGFVRRATYKAVHTIGQLDGHHHRLWVHWVTARRYIGAAEEEVDAWRLSRIDFARMQHHIEGLEDLLAAKRNGQGVVLLTAHFDSLYLGLVQLARAGVVVHVMSTRLIEDPRVPPAIARHFSRKALWLNRLLAPARVMHFEDHMPFFVKALKRGEVVLIACDGPTTSADRAPAVQLLGQRWLMASGPLFLAQAARCPVALYSCVKQGGQRLAISISRPTTVADDGLQLAYTELDRQIRAAPWRWWAADLHSSFVAAPTRPTAQNPAGLPDPSHRSP